MKPIRLLSALAALLLAAGLAACGGGGNSSSSGLTLAEASGVANQPESSAVSSGGEGSLVSMASSSAPEETPEPERHMMTVDEALAYFSTLEPAALGLDGESMDVYQTYPTEKAIPVNGMPCMKIIVYGDSEYGTNEPVAVFLVARDGTAVYRLEDGVAEKLQF